MSSPQRVRQDHNIALARIYDRVMGTVMFPAIRQGFDRAVRRHGITFRCAADVGCGTGTFLRHLSRHAPVFGVDRSAAMLAVAARKTRGRDVTLLQQDMRALDLPGPVDVITCNYDTLNYLLSGEQLRQALSRFASNLRPGGHILGDFLTGNGDAPANGVSRQRIRLPDVRSNWTVLCDPARKRTAVRMKFDYVRPDGKPVTEIETHRQRWFSLRSVTDLLNQCGLRMRRASRFGTDEDADDQTFWVHFVAQKRIQDRATP